MKRLNLEDRHKLVVSCCHDGAEGGLASAQEVVSLQLLAGRVPVVDLELDVLPLLEAVVDDKLVLPLRVVVVLHQGLKLRVLGFDFINLILV
jgi:hypothetical protein